MPSPDIAPYRDLVLDDRTAQQIFDTGLAELRSRGAKLEETHLATWMLEAFALTVEELIYWLRQLPAGISEILMRRFDVVRSVGLPPTVSVQFAVGDDAGYDLPAGINLALGTGVDAVIFRTDTAIAIPPGSTLSPVVTATATALTDKVNGTAAGTRLTLLDGLGYVDTVTTTTVVAGGAGPESDQSYRDRGVQRIKQLSAVLLHPEQFEAFALARPEVSRAHAINNYDPGQAGDPGDHGGHITLAVLGDAGSLSSGQRDAIVTDATPLKAANLGLHVVDPTQTAVDVSTQIVPKAGHVAADVAAAVSEALLGFLDSQSWPWSGVVRRNDLIALIDQVPGVDYVPDGEPSIPAADVPLPGAAALAMAGTIAVTIAP